MELTEKKLICKNILFCFLVVYGCSDSTPVATAMEAAWEYRHMGCNTMSQRTPHQRLLQLFWP
jgi:hypothetical protein